MSAFIPYKHGIVTDTDTITGDAGIAINGNFITIANAMDTLVVSTAPEIAGANCTIDDANAVFSFRGNGSGTPEAAVSFVNTDINIVSAPIFVTDCSIYVSSGSISGANLVVNSVVGTSSSGVLGQLAMIGTVMHYFNGTTWVAIS